jgi:RhtB (resistance to homoserine/threonine) family protein
VEYAATFATLFVTLILVAASPGPAFVMVSQQALSHSRKAGLFAAAGLTVGSLVWVAMVLFGIAVIMREAAWLYTGLRIAGGLYLIYLGVRMWRGAGAPVADEASKQVRPAKHAFRAALMVQLLNPKAAIFFGSIFLTMLPADGPAWIMPAVLAMVTLTEFGWFASVAVVLSSTPAQRAYKHVKAWIERTAGAALALFGLKLAATAR